jgi:hypothetical protein
MAGPLVLAGQVQRASQGAARDPADQGGPVCGGLEHRDKFGPGLTGIELLFVAGGPVTVNDAVEA